MDENIDAIAWKWTWPSIDVELLVSQNVADIFNLYRQNKGVEQGGQLFIDPFNRKGVVLVEASIPHPNDRAGRAWLELDEVRCKQEIIRANAKGLRLIGYWHTHPQRIPRISSEDLNSFFNFSKKYSKELPYPLAVIVGTSHQSDGIKAWSYRSSGYIEAVQNI